MPYTEPADRTAPFEVMHKVTKHDTTKFAEGRCRGLWVGTAGTANITCTVGKTDVELVNFPLKEGLNPIRAVRVKTGGTADDIWAGY